MSQATKNILVTSALPYANGPIHLGHMLEYVQTDIWVRFKKLQGHKCTYVCADDAHGTAIMLKAEQLGRTPEQQIDKVKGEHERDFAAFKVDFVDGLMGSGFKIERASKLPANLSGPLVEKVQQVIQEQVNPAVASHGGHISLIDVKDDVVYVQLGGGCQGCGMADVTLKQGIETTIMDAVPEITAVYDVTDHANGENPYYQSSQ